MADSSQQAAPPVEKMAAMTIEKPTGCLATVESLDAPIGPEATEAIYTSELRGSDESGEGTPKVPYKTILQVLCNDPKGQLISKCPFGVMVWTKVQTNKFDNFCPRL